MATLEILSVEDKNNEAISGGFSRSKFRIFLNPFNLVPSPGHLQVQTTSRSMTSAHTRSMRSPMHQRGPFFLFESLAFCPTFVHVCPTLSIFVHEGLQTFNLSEEI